MSILVTAHLLSKSFAARPLFSGLTFTIESGDRIGLIGPNGAGKSTLLRIIASQISPDDGSLSFQRGFKIGFLEQVPQFESDASIHSTIMEGTDDPYDWENMAAAEEYIAKLELDRFAPETLITKLSGGWRKRVALGRELLRKPDLLLLDEPTNHLDVESILWLEDFLAKAPYATVTITHDRLFLQRVSTRILELDRRNAGGLLNIQGDYSNYLEVKDQMMQAQERREVILKNTLRRETEWLRRGAKARTTKQEARIQRHGKLESEVGELSTRNQVRSVKIDFQSADRNPKKLIEAKNISKTYGDKKIFSQLDLLVTPGTRIGLLGPNGSGKSTLIRVLLGAEETDTGLITRSEHLSVAYFDQARDTLDPALSVMKTLCPNGDYVDYRGSRVHIRGYLDKFLFSQGQMDMAVGKLSGGEQSRLLLARLMLTEANLLVLDEPTNDLDMATLSILEECLVEFNGAVLLVTHDRYFLDQVANKIVAFAPDSDNKGLVSFSSFEQWEVWHAEEEKAKIQKVRQKGSANDPSKGPHKKRKLTFKEQRELETMEEKIHSIEATLVSLTQESTKPENMSNSTQLARLSAAMNQAQTEINQLYSRWSELENKTN